MVKADKLKCNCSAPKRGSYYHDASCNIERHHQDIERRRQKKHDNLMKAKGKADLIEKLNKKMGSLSLSGGSYGQLDGEETEATRTISAIDWEKIKKEAKA